MLRNTAVVITVVVLGLFWCGSFLGASWLDRRKGSKFKLDVAAVGGLALLTGAFFWRPLFESGVTMPMGGGDLASFQYPMYVFSGQSFHSGDFPLWNPHLFAGMPYAADIQSGLFYPLNLLFFWFGYPIDYPKTEMLVVLHYWLAGCFTYAFLKSLNLHRWSAFIGGTVFAFSGFAIAHLGHLPMFEAATWFPVALLAANQMVRRRSLAWSVFLGLVLAIDFLAGHFQLFVYITYATLAFLITLIWFLHPTGKRDFSSEQTDFSPSLTLSSQARFRFSSLKRLTSLYITNPNKNWWFTQGLLVFISFLVMGGAILVQLWPFYELGNLSVRSGITYETSTQFGVWPIGLAELLLPNLFETNPTNYYGQWSNTEVLGYLGLFSYILAIIGFLLGKQPKIYSWFFGALALLGLLFSLSGYTVLQGWLYQFVPALKLMRASGRFLLWFDFGGAVLVGFGVQAILNWLHEPHEFEITDVSKTLKWAWRSTGLISIALLLIPLSLLYSTILTNPGNNNDLLIRGINSIVLAVILLGIGAVLLRAFLHRSIKPGTAAFLILALLVFDLFSARANFNPTTQDVTTGFNQAPIANFLHQHDPQNLHRIDVTGSSATQAWQPDTADIYSLDDVQGVFNPLQLAKFDTLWNAVVKLGKDFRSSPAYSLFNVGYVIARNKEDPSAAQFQTIFKDTRSGINLNVDENKQTLGRAWVVHRSVIQPDDKSLADILSPDFKPTETVFLSKGQAIDTAGGTPVNESVRLLNQSNNSLKLEANLDSQGYLVLSQAYYPGWKVQVDGKDATLENADYAFNAILLTPGNHIVMLEYSPASFFIGAIISGIVWLGATIFLIFCLFRLRFNNKKRLQSLKVNEDASKAPEKIEAIS